jgi:hypothetical protein
MGPDEGREFPEGAAELLAPPLPEAFSFAGAQPPKEQASREFSSQEKKASNRLAD